MMNTHATKTTARTMNATSIGDVLAEYERMARNNRPDWDQFVADAKEDPWEIGYEVADVAWDMNVRIDLDEIFDASETWIDSL